MRAMTPLDITLMNLVMALMMSSVTILLVVGLPAMVFWHSWIAIIVSMIGMIISVLIYMWSVGLAIMRDE